VTTSHHTTPPEYIAGALMRLDFQKPHDGSVISHHEYANAVWAALLEHGEIRVRMRPPPGTVGDWPLNELTEQRVLVVPLANPNTPEDAQ
jgi:hypothetical protein